MKLTFGVMVLALFSLLLALTGPSVRAEQSLGQLPASVLKKEKCACQQDERAQKGPIQGQDDGDGASSPSGEKKVGVGS